MSSSYQPSTTEQASPPFRRAAILFAGGPAPAANAVISTAAISFLRAKFDVVGILYGYSGLVKYSPERPLVVVRDYVQIDYRMLKRTRNTQGILIGTARSNPGKSIGSPDHFDDLARIQPIKATYAGLCSLGIDVLVSIGGDDTLKTANKLKLFQDHLYDTPGYAERIFPEGLPAGARRIPIVHVPKTIDNDYSGIDFTFGYFTAVETLAAEVRNLLFDAESARTYFLAETMGRSAGWLAYGTAIAGEASLVISVEDIRGHLLDHEDDVDDDGHPYRRPIMKVDAVVDWIVKMMLAREKQFKEYGVIILAEGLAEFMPKKDLADVPRDDHGHISVAHVALGKRISKLVAKEYHRRTGKERKVTGLQLGYEARCARPHAFDVMLGSQLGVGAYRALVEEKLNGVMVSVEGQFKLHYVPFDTLVDPETLTTVVRYIDYESDFHKLARFLEISVND